MIYRIFLINIIAYIGSAFICEALFYYGVV